MSQCSPPIAALPAMLNLALVKSARSLPCLYKIRTQGRVEGKGKSQKELYTCAL